MKTRLRSRRSAALTARSSSAGPGILALALLAAPASHATAQQRFAALGPPLAGNVTYTHGIAAGDLDRDGDVDLVLSRNPSVLLLNDGYGNFEDVTATHLPRPQVFTYAMALADVDGDGDLDLLQVGNSNENRLYLNDGSGVFLDVSATHLPPPVRFTGSESLAMGDIDGDGDLDAVLGNVNGIDANHLWINDGHGVFSDVTATQLPVDSDWTYALALADVDGDGDLDLVLGNHREPVGLGTAGGRNRLYLNDGQGTFSDVTATHWITPAQSTNALVLLDFDADGAVDIVCGNGGQDRAYRNDGNGHFLDVTASTVPADADGTTTMAAADVDGDGDTDLILGQGGDQPFRMLLADGAGGFEQAPAAWLPATDSFSTGMLLEDVDADGDPDLVATHTAWNGTATEDRVYRNLERQLHAPAPPTIGQPYQLDVYARHGQPSLFEVALPCVALAPASVPLPPIGTLGLDPNGLIPLQPVLISPATGMASTTIPIPNRPSLAGTDLFGQALMIRYPGHESLTNVTRGTLH